MFPLFSDIVSDVEYQLSEEALCDNSVSVQEVSEAGSIPRLLVDNKGASRILFLEGEQLIGAKQNRILNTSVLVAAGSKIEIPVTCAEQGRWRYRSHNCRASGSHSPPMLRRLLKASVSRSTQARRGHSSDQAAVWKEILALHARHDVPSSTAALNDAFSSCEHRIAEFHERLPYVSPAVGVAISIQHRIVSLDVFDRPSTCERAWAPYLTGAALDALQAGDSDPSFETMAVERLLNGFGELDWQPVEVVGEGQEYRAESRTGDQASALEFNSVVLHGSILTSR
jgi:hypothetical protein